MSSRSLLSNKSSIRDSRWFWPHSPYRPRNMGTSTGHRVASVFGVLLVTMVIITSTGSAQPCETLPIDELPVSYRFRANVPRCEGMYRSPVSGEQGMTLVSLTNGRVAYDTRRDKYLEIGLPFEPTEKTLIRAVGVPERLYYRLDVELGPGRRVFRLPLRDVVAAENILPEAFGVYGVRRLRAGQDAFLPVHAHPPGGESEAEIIAVIRPGADVSDVHWRRYAPAVPPTPWAPVVGASGLVPEGMRLEIMLGKDLPPQTTLEVSFLSQGIGRADRFVLFPR